MSLTGQEKRSLIAAAHALHPIVIIGNQGLSKAVIAEIDRALHDHELIKVRVPGGQWKDEKTALGKEIAEVTEAECLRIIGNILILFRENPED